VETESIGTRVTVGAQCVVGPSVSLGSGVVLHPLVVITGDVSIADGTEVFAGAVIGKSSATSAALSREPGRASTVTIAERCSIGAHAVIYSDIEIGADSLVGDLASIREQCRIGARCIIGRGVSLHPECTIGHETRIYDDSHLAVGTSVGRACFLAAHVCTTSDNALGRLPYSRDRVRGPVIGDRVAVGSGALILPGIVLGDDATVAAGSLVTRDVPPGATVLGRPARCAGPSE
jgi:acetyltransferase-like isoleucine patch superfamily enzyme